MGYTEPFELAISRIDSPMSPVSSGQITTSNGALFGILSAHFDDGLKMSNFKKSSPITQFYRFWHRFYVFYRFFFKFSKSTPLSKSDLKTPNYAPFEAAIFRDESLDIKLLIRKIAGQNSFKMTIL